MTIWRKIVLLIPLIFLLPQIVPNPTIGVFLAEPIADFVAVCTTKNYSHVNNPLERIETAIRWLKNNGNRKIGIMGMSTAGMDSLVAASFFPDITLTFALTASDFVRQGFEQGNKDGCKEWPV